MPCKKAETFLPGKHVKGSVYGYRYNGKSQLVCQLERAPSEMGHVPCKAARTFGKNNQTCAVTQNLTRLVIGLLNGFGATLINKNMLCALTRLAEKRHTPN